MWFGRSSVERGNLFGIVVLAPLVANELASGVVEVPNQKQGNSINRKDASEADLGFCLLKRGKKISKKTV